jgi:hypothetical protein
MLLELNDLDRSLRAAGIVPGVTEQRIQPYPKRPALEVRRTRSRAEGDSRSEANKVRHNESRSCRRGDRGNLEGRVGVSDRSALEERKATRWTAQLKG